MITLKRFRRIEAAVRTAGFANEIKWSENIVAPADAEDFAQHAIYVIINSGFRTSVAVLVHERCMHALTKRRPLSKAFRHERKVSAIRTIWRDRSALYQAFLAADDKLDFCETLPFVGPVTRYHLAKNLGVDTAKQDLHLDRLARRDETTAAKLCGRLARKTGYRTATVDTILWRACVEGILDSRRYLAAGWTAAFAH